MDQWERWEECSKVVNMEKSYKTEEAQCLGGENKHLFLSDVCDESKELLGIGERGR